MKALERAQVTAGAVPSATVQPAPAPIVAAPPQPSLPPEPPSPPPASVPLSPPPPSTPQKIGFEEKFGTRWVVWVGGVALALGGIFLVRYTIQQGLIGPGVRIFLGALLALALVAVGEWTRRTEKLSVLAGVPSAHIPSTLTAAGTTVAYATVYAAYELYGFLPPAAAFILLGAVALLTLGAALLHGPALAGLGVIGGYLAPMLVASVKPDFWSLYVYIAVVNAAAFALARFRMWRWLAIAAIVLGALWTLPGTQADTVTALGAHVFHALAGFALVATFLVCGLFYGPPAVPGAVDRLSTLALSVYLLAAALLVLASRHDPVALAAFVVLTVATVAIAWRTEAATGAVPVAAILAASVMAHWAVHMNVQGLLAPSGPAAPAIPEPERYDYGSHLILAAGWAALFGAGGFLAQGRSSRALAPMLWSAAAVFTPLAMLVALYYRIAQLDRSLPFAALALLVAAIFALATETLVKREPRPGVMAASAMFATGTLGALALAMTFALEKGWLTIALALTVPGIAWVAEQRPLPWLRWLAAVMVAVVAARVAYQPTIAGADLGTAPIFNWLLYGYGVPAAAFWVAGWLLRRRADDLPARMVDAGAILFTVLLAILEIRHYVTGGNIYRRADGVVEAMLYVNVGLAMTIGLERVRGRTGSIVHNAGALLIAALTLIAVIYRIPVRLEPALRQRSGGRPVLQPDPVGLRTAGGARHHLGADRAHHASDLLSRHRDDHRGDARSVLSDARSAAAVSWADIGRADQRCRAICLFDRLARFRHRAACGRLLPALAAGAAARARRHRADRRQGLHHRYREHQRHLPRAIGDRAWRGAARHRLGLPARALSAGADRGSFVACRWANRPTDARSQPMSPILAPAQCRA